MSIKELLEAVPQLFNLFIPGFVFLIIYKYFKETKEEDFNITTIGSIVLTYIFQLITTLLCKYIRISETVRLLIPILLAVVCALIVVKIRLLKFYKKITTWIGRTTSSNNIWYDLFDLNKGTRIRFFAKYNNDDVVVEGDVKYFEAYGDGECNIVISNYNIEYIGNSKNIYKNSTPNATMIINSKNLYGLEAHYGQ